MTAPVLDPRYTEGCAYTYGADLIDDLQDGQPVYYNGILSPARKVLSFTMDAVVMALHAWRIRHALPIRSNAQNEALALAIEISEELEDLDERHRKLGVATGVKTSDVLTTGAHDKTTLLIAMLNTEGCMSVQAENEELRKLVQWVIERMGSHTTKYDALRNEWHEWFEQADEVLGEHKSPTKPIDKEKSPT